MRKRSPGESVRDAKKRTGFGALEEEVGSPGIAFAEKRRWSKTVLLSGKKKRGSVLKFRATQGAGGVTGRLHVSDP